MRFALCLSLYLFLSQKTQRAHRVEFHTQRFINIYYGLYIKDVCVVVCVFRHTNKHIVIVFISVRLKDKNPCFIRVFHQFQW